jgi:hypothetical protein
MGADVEVPDAPGMPDGAPERGRRRTWCRQQKIGVVVQERKAQPPLMTCRFAVLAAFLSHGFRNSTSFLGLRILLLPRLLVIEPSPVVALKKGLVVLKKNSHLLTFFSTTASNHYQARSSVHTQT